MTMRPMSCDSEAARWFLARGYVVAFPMRRGYAGTGGPWAESYGRVCDHADYVHAGLESARDIDAVVEYVTRLPGVRPDGAVVVGQSAGGWGTVAYDSIPHPRVRALISMAGGRGGHQHDEPNQNCRPDLLADAAGAYGHTASTPMLWIYSENDTFFAPDLARAMAARFNQSGGQAELHQLPPFGKDGHSLFPARGGSAIWGPLVEAYLGRQLGEVRGVPGATQ
jgi:dienelactone hydrolase